MCNPTRSLLFLQQEVRGKKSQELGNLLGASPPYSSSFPFVVQVGCNIFKYLASCSDLARERWPGGGLLSKICFCLKCVDVYYYLPCSLSSQVCFIAIGVVEHLDVGSCDKARDWTTKVV
jgi:hypothetical protein